MARSYAKSLDQTLVPLGFKRSGDDWVRVRGDMWECVNRQSSQWAGVTVNLLVKDIETEKLFLTIFGSEGAVVMPPITTRIGELMGGPDRWWRSSEAGGPDEMMKLLLQYGLPWFDEVRTLEEQAEHWYARKTALSSRGYHGLSLVGLALTLYRMGEIEEACKVLHKPIPRTAIKVNVAWVAKTRAWLGCDPAT